MSQDKPIRGNEEKTVQPQEELYEQHIDEKAKPASLISRFPSSYIIIFALCMAYIFYLVQNHSITWKQAMPYIAFISVVVLVLGLKKAASDEIEDSDFISERRAKAIVWGELKWKQHNSPDEVPAGEIKMQSHCVLRYFNGKPWRWEVAYKIHSNDGRIKWYVAAVHAKNGYIVEIFPRVEGFGPKDAPHIIKKEVPMRPMRNQRQGLFGGLMGRNNNNNNQGGGNNY